MKGWESNNEFCVKHGHNWILTTSDSFRKCDRSSCSTVEKLVNGVWVLISKKGKKRKTSGKTIAFINLPLF